ncbi:MAG: HAD family phosphatase [Clostridia bacterium]|nr:HAD family phosphatase [Clostridia bacterium]
MMFRNTYRRKKRKKKHKKEQKKKQKEKKSQSWKAQKVRKKMWRKAMIKNIVFDVGNVLVDYDPEKFMIGLGFDEKTREAVNGAIFHNKLWDEADRGVMSWDELVEGFVAQSPAYEQEIRKAAMQSGDTVELMPYAVEWVKSLKEQGYHLYILSNYGEYTFEHSKHKMEFLPYMDGTLFSYTCKMAKPDLEIYQYLCDKFGLKPEESVFLDDRLENVEVARSAGLHGIWFKDYEQSGKELQELCIKTSKY